MATRSGYRGAAVTLALSTDSRNELYAITLCPFKITQSREPELELAERIQIICNQPQIDENEDFRVIEASLINIKRRNTKCYYLKYPDPIFWASLCSALRETFAPDYHLAGFYAERFIIPTLKRYNFAVPEIVIDLSIIHGIYAQTGSFPTNIKDCSELSKFMVWGIKGYRGLDQISYWCLNDLEDIMKTAGTPDLDFEECFRDPLFRAVSAAYVYYRMYLRILHPVIISGRSWFSAISRSVIAKKEQELS